MTTIRITVKGLVQGIGYRPFVAELAEHCQVGGWVRNTDGIVTILVSGETAQVEYFLQELQVHSPEGASVEALVWEELPYQQFLSFAIRESERTNEAEKNCRDKSGLWDESEDRVPELKENLGEAECNTEGVRERKREFPIVPADLPTCEQCLREMHDARNRRYRHAFISCTSCGPRYSIIEKLPYDRENISMNVFPMCEACEMEYKQQGNRRRHAQTIACPDCGPVLSFVEIAARAGEKAAGAAGENAAGAEGKAAEENVARADEIALQQAIRLLRKGGIVAVKDIGGYHLACTPFSEEAVQRLRLLKGREKKPFAVMFPDMQTIRQYCEVSEEEESLLQSAPRPIVLLRKKRSGSLRADVGKLEEKSEAWKLAECMDTGRYTEKVEAWKLAEGMDAGKLAENVCGSSPDIGAMLPCNPLQTLLLEELGPLIMTSANASGELLLLDNEKMLTWMQQRREEFLPDEIGEMGVLSHDRPILTPLDDSIVRVACGRTQIFRRARGFVPNPIRIKVRDNIFAAGGDLKAGFCYTGDGKAYLSQYLGDLEDEGCRRAYEKEKMRMRELFGFEPEYFACDMHPGYVSAGMTAKDTAPSQRACEDVSSQRADTAPSQGVDAAPSQRACEEAPSQRACEKVPSQSPEYNTSGKAAGRNPSGEHRTGIYPIQHHEAHVASVIAEHGLIGTVLGFAFDGTGYGRDQTIWGSETFFWNGKGMERIAHLKPVRLIGGDEGAKNADAILFGYLASFSEKIRERVQKNAHLISGFDLQRFQLVEKAIQCNINTVISSSMGRLFDAVSAFLGICHYNGYEGEAAIELENLAVTAEKAYKLSICMECDEVREKQGRSPYEADSVPKKTGAYQGNTEPLFSGMLDALEQGIPRAEIARGFVEAVSEYICRVCEKCSVLAVEAKELLETEQCAYQGTRQVVLSGGTFQNRILLEHAIEQLEASGYQVYINEQVPSGDGGICLGQAFLCEVACEENGHTI